MRRRQGMWISAAVALLCTAALADADCLPTFRVVSSIGVFPNRLAGPAATNGSILGVAKTESDNAVYFATYSSDLAQLTPDVKVADASLNGAAALLWTGSEFGLFYRAPSMSLMLQRIDVSGNLIGASIALANHGWSAGDEFDVIWVPARNGYALGRTVTNGADHGLWVTILSPSGAVQFDVNVSVFVSPPTFPHVVALPDGKVELAWARSGDAPLLALSSVSPSGAVGIATISQRAIADLRMAASGTSILIIDAVTTAGGTELRYARIGTADNVLTADSPFLTGSGIDIAPRSLIWNAALSEWALVYVDAPAGLSAFPGDTRLRRFASPTGFASDAFLAPDASYSRLAAPFAPVFLNGGYIASIARRLSQVEGSESYLIKSCPFIVTASADHPIWQPYLPITFTAHPSGGLPGFSYTWNLGDLSTQTGAVVQHAYNVPGVYTITLSATDAAGAQSIYTFTVQVAFPRRRAAR